MNVLRFQLKITDLEAFHRQVKDRYYEEFPLVPNYEKFLKATNKSSEFTLLIIRHLLYINRSLTNQNILFTPGNIHDSKTLEDMASDLKGTLTCDAGYLVKDKIP